MKLNAALPSGIAHNKHEYFDPEIMRGILIMQFIPDVPEKEDREEESKCDTVRSTISNSVEKHYKVFKGGGPVAVILLIYQHQAIIASKELKKNYVTTKSLIDAKKV